MGDAHGYSQHKRVHLHNKPICKLAHMNRGYSLPEVLTYIAILAVVSIIVINTVLITAKAFSQAQNIRALNASAETAMERIVREIRFAESVDTGASTFNTNPGILVLTSIDPFTETVQIVTIAVSGGRVTLRKNAQPAEFLTSDDVAVNNLVFRHIVAGTVSETIRVEMQIGSANFFDTAVLRRSY